MPFCETCGNEYDSCMKVELDGKLHTYDCFECAIDDLAPRCSHCQVRIIGHGMQVGANFYCSAHCARTEGYRDLADHQVTHVA